MKRLIKQFIKNIARTKEDNINRGNIFGANCSIYDVSLGISNKVGSNCYLYKTSLGDFTYLSQNVSAMNTTIGKFCSIGQGTCIGLGNHPSSIFVSTHPSFFSTNNKCGYTFAKETFFNELGKNVIGNDVWIGINAIIMNNVIIGNGAIVGAGAVVTKHVPDYAIVIGSPAKIIRYRFNEDEIASLLKFNWWDKDYEWIEKNYRSFNNINDFMELMKIA